MGIDAAESGLPLEQVTPPLLALNVLRKQGKKRSNSFSPHYFSSLNHDPPAINAQPVEGQQDLLVHKVSIVGNVCRCSLACPILSVHSPHAPFPFHQAVLSASILEMLP